MLQGLVDRKEVLDLFKHMLGQILDVTVGGVVGVVERNSDDFFVPAVAVDHVEQADRLALDQRHGQDLFAAQHKHIQRVAVVGKGARNKAVVGRVVGRGEQHAVKLEHTGFFVQLIFILVALRNFDNGKKVIGCNAFW